MAKQFETEIRETHGKYYLKVFLYDISEINDVRNKLETLRSVGKINITQNREVDLTVYPARVCDVRETKREVETSLSAYFLGKSQQLEDPTIQETADSLVCSPKAKELYDSAIEKYSYGKHARNTLDDMRLSLEIHLKTILNNKKSLENQLPEVGKYIQEKGLSKDLANMFQKLLEYYSKYQNTYVKHDDAVNEKEIKFIIQQTNSFMQMFS